MASEAFIQGNKYYGPGAGLAVAGNNFGIYREKQKLTYNSTQYGTGPHDVNDEGNAVWVLGIDDYRGPQSVMGAYIANVAASASSWTNITAEACRKEYQACQGRRQYGDVLIVLDVHGEPEGYDGCKY